LRQFDRALPHYRALLKRDPADAGLNNKVGFVFLNVGDCSNAVRYFKNALRSDPTNPSYWNNLGAARYRLGDLAAAEKAFLSSLALRPGSPRVLYNLAVVNFYRRRYGKSLEYLLKAYGSDKRYVESRFSRRRFADELGEMRRRYPADRELAEIERLFLEKNRAPAGKR
jgi:Flp pilus assembly protein TadD